MSKSMDLKLFDDLEDTGHLEHGASNGSSASKAPLAYELAPTDFEELVGQPHILSPGNPLRELIESDRLGSIILWGPPGCGKTSLSRLISKKTKAHYIAINAVTANLADIKSAIQTAKLNAKQSIKTILFIDEIHRFNKVQQDALLPEVEKGILILIGATTENPYFSVIPSLLSRVQVYELKPLEPEDLMQILEHALQKRHKTVPLEIEKEAKDALVTQSRGDARRLLNSVELLINTWNGKTPITKAQVMGIQEKGIPHSDDSHYDIISALIKSMRASDPNAAVYWLARLIKGGEDPAFIARRLVIFASEDIGNADPAALPFAVSVMQAVQFIGMPEAQLNLSHGVTYLASAPKSNASYLALNKALKAIDAGAWFPVPQFLKDSHYKGARKMGHGAGYQYPHEFPEAITGQAYLPEPLSFYEPTEYGHEKAIKERMLRIQALKKEGSES